MSQEKFDVHSEQRHSPRAEPSEVEVAPPWPFPDGRFPQQLGAAVMVSVLEGSAPALQVVHFIDGTWGVADGVTIPDDHSLVATHLWHILDSDPTLHQLASLPPGYQADRDSLSDAWVRSVHVPPQKLKPLERVRYALDAMRYGEQEATRRLSERTE